MRRGFACLALLISIAVGSRSEAAIALIQAKAAHYVTTTSGQTTFTSPVTTADVVGIFIATNSSSSAAPSSVLDSNSDTVANPVAWTSVAAVGTVGVYLFPVGTGSSSFKITVNFAGNTTFNVVVFDYSGVSTTTPADKVGTVYHATSGSPSTGAALTPTQAGDQQLAFLTNATPQTLSSWGDSLVAQANNITGSATAYFADLLLASTSAVNAAAAMSATTNWGLVQLLLNPAGGGGSSCTNTGWTSAGAFTVPTASVTSVWLKTGAFGTTDCSATQYWQASGAFGAN